jgi:dihydrofolate reductase
MPLPNFSVIVAIDCKGGICKNGKIPWNSPDDVKFFRKTTIGNKNNVVIMGRATYESLPSSAKPLRDRRCVIISKKRHDSDHPDVLVYPSIRDALEGISNLKYDDVFVAGGEGIYNEIVGEWLGLCNKIYVTRIPGDYECDKFFPIDTVERSCRMYPEKIDGSDLNVQVYLPN